MRARWTLLAWSLFGLFVVLACAALVLVARRVQRNRTLDGFAAQLRNELDLDSSATELRHAVADTMRPAHVLLWLRSGS